VIKKILRNINILNIVLIGAVIAFAVDGVLPTLRIGVTYSLPSAAKDEHIVEKEPVEPRFPSAMEYAAIVDENLFHPERRIPPEKKAEAPLPKPEFVLYGTMISDDLSLAYVEDLKAPRNTPGRGKRQVALKKGDSMSGFVLKEIQSDKIVMVRGEERLVVAINDPEKSKSREIAPAPQAQHQISPPPSPTPARPRREPRGVAPAVQP